MEDASYDRHCQQSSGRPDDAWLRRGNTLGSRFCDFEKVSDMDLVKESPMRLKFTSVIGLESRLSPRYTRTGSSMDRT